MPAWRIRWKYTANFRVTRRAAGTARIRLLWIDGDHTYAGCKEDFDLFSPFLADGGVVAFHDTLNTFEGPIRVFVEEVLRSDRFGACGFVHSISWGQFRPQDGSRYRSQRAHHRRQTRRKAYSLRHGWKRARRVPQKIIQTAALSDSAGKPISPSTFLQMIAAAPHAL